MPKIVTKLKSLTDIYKLIVNSTYVEKYSIDMHFYYRPQISNFAKQAKNNYLRGISLKAGWS